jgi:hypothetical protein
VKRALIILAGLCAWVPRAAAQDDLLALLEEESASKKHFVSATFKGTRLINFHTVEVPGEHSLEFRIAHHFGDFNTGGYNFWGLDGGATIRMGLEYSKEGRFCVGVGRSSLEKMYDGFLKFKLIRQTTTRKKNPFTVTLFSGMFYTAMDDPNKSVTGIDRYQFETSRLSYCHQIHIARKFNDKFSLQISPTLVHYNMVDFLREQNDLYVVAALARYKFTPRVAFTVEYGYRVNERDVYFDAVGAGFDIETGGHVFQMYFTNSAGMVEPQFFGRTTSSVETWGIKLGFNISRMFTVGGGSER